MNAALADRYEANPILQEEIRPQVEEIQNQMVALLDRLQGLSAQCHQDGNLEESILFLQRSLSCISLPTEESEGDLVDAIDWRAFGERLLQRRSAAKIQQKELARSWELLWPASITRCGSSATRSVAVCPVTISWPTLPWPTPQRTILKTSAAKTPCYRGLSHRHAPTG